MPGIRNPAPLDLNGCEIIARKADGHLAQQREAMATLLRDAGWPNPTKEASGRLRMGDLHCSLSHGGGWVAAVRGKQPVGVDVEEATDRLTKVRRRFVGPADRPILARFGDNLDSLCRLWTAKEAVFKTFGTAVDFLTGIDWDEVQEDGARLTAIQHGIRLELRWVELESADGPTWLAVATALPEDEA